MRRASTTRARWKQRLGASYPSGHGTRQRSRPDQRDHAGDGLDDRLGHFYCLRGNFARSAIAGAADRGLADHRIPDDCGRAQLRRTGGDDAARRRTVRLSARVARSAMGIFCTAGLCSSSFRRGRLPRWAWLSASSSGFSGRRFPPATGFSICGRFQSFRWAR